MIIIIVAKQGDYTTTSQRFTSLFFSAVAPYDVLIIMIKELEVLAVFSPWDGVKSIHCCG
jgi:hypothetical protein